MAKFDLFLSFDCAGLEVEDQILPSGNLASMVPLAFTLQLAVMYRLGSPDMKSVRFPRELPAMIIHRCPPNKLLYP